MYDHITQTHTYQCPRSTPGDWVGAVAALAIGYAVEAGSIVAQRIVVAKVGDAAITNIEAHAKKNQADRYAKQASNQKLSAPW